MIALDTNGVKGEFFFMYIDKYIKGVGLFHTDVIWQKEKEKHNPKLLTLKVR